MKLKILHIDSEKHELKFCLFLKTFLKMVLTKCIPSLQVKCIKILVEVFYYVTVRLISSVTSFSFPADLLFFSFVNCFLLDCLLANTKGKFRNIPGEHCVFDITMKTSIKGNVI